MDPCPDLNYIAPLDGLRGIAALMVIVLHLYQSGFLATIDLPLPLSNIFTIGGTGVDLFFVLSGFLITRILLATKGRSRYFHNFYARRSLRIFPLYYFALLVWFVVLPAIEPMPTWHLSEQWWCLAYLQNIAATFWQVGTIPGPAHFWSLAVEEHFYLVWPALVFITPRRAIVALSISVIAAAVVCRAVLLSRGYGVFLFTPCRMDALAMGAVLAAVEPQISTNPRFKKRIVLSALGILVVLLTLWPFFTGSHSVLLQLWKFSAIGFVYLGLVAYVSFQRGSVISLLLATRPLIFVGTISYGLYVYHPFCFVVIRVACPHGLGIASAIVAVALTFVVATLSFYLFETPFLRLKRFFARPST